LKIEWRTGAWNQLIGIYRYVSQDSNERAIDLCRRLIEATGQLAVFPYSGALLPEDGAYRQIVVEGYRIVYVIAEKEIQVMTIMAPRSLYREPKGRD
jgi:plasmid stabilization system protein ParE